MLVRSETHTPTHPPTLCACTAEDEDEDEHMMGDGGMMDMGGMMGGGEWVGMSPDMMFSAGEDGEDGLQDGGMGAATSAEDAAVGLGGDGDGDGAGDGASPQDRAAMLAHLDSILTVPPQFQVQEGQFDDPGEDDEGEGGGPANGVANGYGTSEVPSSAE